TVHYEFDAGGRPVVVEPVPDSIVGTVNYNYTYDQMGRPLEGHAVSDYSNNLLFAYDYDNDGGTGTSCPSTSNTMGRLRKRTDSFGVTYLSYDSEGRIVEEIRMRSGLSSCGTAH